MADQTRRKTKKDLLLLIAILVVVGVAAAALIPAISAGVISGQYKTFVSRYTDSMNLSRKMGKVTVVTDSGEEKTSVDGASQIYSLILDAGMGKPQSQTPESPGKEIRFADGAVMQFWGVEIPEASARRQDGLFVRYQATDGYIYQYDTDKLTMDSITVRLN
ncbi:MAG: hypothetical protein IJ106_10200 [Parasporobacterium sp.]|nr:hypothetical protein [Parasporobacterium sp.]